MEADTLQVGDLFETRYRVERRLGEGGFAVVFEAMDLVLDRRVALKVLTRDAGDDYAPATRARLGRELRAVAQLRSPHTVRMFAHGSTDDGTLYVVFELLPGRDLSEVLGTAGPLPPATAEHILRQLLEALAEAHRLGVIHRDLKPENVRVVETASDPWAVKLLDFGIARPMQAGGAAQITKTGELIGTPRYMSPEQLTEKPLTPASDIYTLGMMLFEMLAGREQLAGASWGAQIDRLRSGFLFASPAAEHSEHARLYGLVQRMTARNVADRIPTAVAALAALDVQPSAPRVAPGAGGRVRRGQKRSFRAALAGGILALLAIGVALLLRPEPSETSTPLEPPPRSRSTVDPELPFGHGPVEPPLHANSHAPCKLEPGSNEISVDWGLSRKKVSGQVPVRTPDHPMSLLVAFHDGQQSPEQLLGSTDLRKFANEHGYLLIAPTGKLSPFAAKRDPPTLSSQPWVDGEELLYAVDVVQTVADRECVDRERVFALGRGRGAVGVVRAGRHIHFAAAVHWAHRDASRLDPSYVPVPLLLLAPTKDPKRPKDGKLDRDCMAEKVLSFEQQEALYREAHGCDGEPQPYDDLGGETCYRDPTCETLFVSCHVHGGADWLGHYRKGECNGPPSSFRYPIVIKAFFDLVVERRAEVDSTAGD